RLHEVLRKASPVGVHHAEVELRLPVALIGGLAKPGDRRHLVAWHAQTAGIADAEVCLGGGEALVGRPPVPLGGLAIVAGQTRSVRVEEAEMELRSRVPGFGGAAKPLCGL